MKWEEGEILKRYIKGIKSQKWKGKRYRMGEYMGMVMHGERKLKGFDEYPREVK